MKVLDIQFPSEVEYQRLRAIRDKHGVRWRGMLLQGAKQLMSADLRQTLTASESEVDIWAFEAAFWRPDGECGGDPSVTESRQPLDSIDESVATPDRTQNDEQEQETDDDNETTDEPGETGQDTTVNDEQSSTSDTAGADTSITDDNSPTTSTRETPSAGNRPPAHPAYPAHLADRFPRTERDLTGYEY